MSNLYEDQLKTLVGYKIVDTFIEEEEDSHGGQFFGIVVSKCHSMKAVVFLSDDEGNAPGAFDIIEVPVGKQS